MTMISVSNDKIFCLSNDNITYALGVSKEGFLEHLHFGGRLYCTDGLRAHKKNAERILLPEFQGIEGCSLHTTALEYPVFGTSDYRMPCFHGINRDGNTTFLPLYESYEILDQKPVLEGLPSASGGSGKDGDESQTLVITLRDSLYDLRIDLLYTIYSKHDAITRSVKLTNESKDIIELNNAFSSCLDLPPANYELLHLHGAWAREFGQQRLTVPNGRFVIESARGSSSAAHNPFVAMMQRGTNENQGRVYGTSLVYSGNFAISIEKNEFDDVRVLTGLNSFNFHWTLESGGSFTCPEAIHVFSEAGLTGMSHIWHSFIQNKITPQQHAHKPRLTYLNSWEANYFDITEQSVLDLADCAKDIGVEMLVVDDGWFQGRTGETKALGDWTADTDRFPNGIPALAEKVKAKGLVFGLWFEPEMVNADSELFRTHPEWIVHVPQRKPSKGRLQYILDLSRPEVVDYIFNQMDAILSCGDIGYIKWDMNRNKTEVGSAHLPPHQQRETQHRYILGLYALLDRLVSKYPDIVFENCASGGNRFDLGMLSYMPQGWLSDMSDPIGRLWITNGASHIYPLETFASYIGPVPNHQNGRLTSIKTRYNYAFFCASRGMSLNVEDIKQDEEELKQYIKLLKQSSRDIIGGAFYRLLFKENEICWQLNSADGNTVYVGYFRILAKPNMPFKRTYLKGLDREARYELQDKEETSTMYGGATLMNTGLAVPYLTSLPRRQGTTHMDKGDFSSCLLVLKKCPVGYGSV